MNLKNKVAVITGAGSGIGAGLARYAAGQGMQVIATDVDEKGLASLLVSINNTDSVMTRKLDVTDADQVDKLAQDVFDHYGKVNYLFNNAGVLVDGKSWTRTDKDWRWIIDVNIMGVVNGIRSFVPRMLKQTDEGRVINTASIGGLLAGGAFMAPYQMTKHAIIALTESLHQELALEGDLIKASVLCPGEVNTGIWESDRLRHEQTQRNSKSEQMFHHYVSTSSKSAITPDIFAERAFAAIAQNKFWLFPQPEFKSMYQLRVDSILNESDPPTMKKIPKG